VEPEATSALEALKPLVGLWTMEMLLPQAPPSDVRGHVAFEWGPGEAFLLQRWEVPVPEAPDGVAVIAFDEDRGELIQHYFDSRGVARRYGTAIEDGTWTLRKLTPGFAQRFRGEFSPSGDSVEGAWEKADEGSEDWELDFRLVYRRVG
jgi:hypothetical protein